MRLNRTKGEPSLTVGLAPEDYFCRPFHGLCRRSSAIPALKVLGYFQIVRFADVDEKCFMNNPD